MTADFLSVMLEASIRTSIAAVLVLGVLWLLGARSSGIREPVWTAVLIAMLAMPVLPSVAPSFEMRLPAVALLLTSDVSTPTLLQSAATSSPSAPSVAQIETSRATPELPRSRPSPVIETASRSVTNWPAILIAIYACGVAVLMLRLVIGLLGMRRVFRRARRLDLPGVRDAVYESRAVSVPLTAGVVRPRVILPLEWSAWDAEQLAAVLAHEREHIRRRDPALLLVAFLNRCVFWFHPLSWWLERELATAAEEACDDAGMRATGERRRYAEVLVEMARVVGRQRGRVVWAGVGIDGAGMLRRRIDRILRDEAIRPLSMPRKLAVVSGCVAAIAIAVACRQVMPPAPLKENPEFAERLAFQASESAFFNAARAMSEVQVAEREAIVSHNPEDLVSRKKLLIFYEASGHRVLGWNEMVAARRPHVLWLIANHPASELVLYARGMTPAYDPAGH